MALADLINDLAGYANPYGAPSVGKWNLERGVFQQLEGENRSIVFFYEKPDKEEFKKKTALEQAQDTGGRRLAVYEYPYRDGQASADLGRKGETFSFNIKFFGEDYQAKFNEFLSVVRNYSGKGNVIHPIRGAIPCRFKDYEFVHRYDEFNAVTIKAIFIENNIDFAQATVENLVPTASSVIRQSLSKLSYYQAVIAKAISEGVTLSKLPSSIENGVQARLGTITGSYSTLIGALAATFGADSATTGVAATAAESTGGNITQVSSGTAVIQDNAGNSQQAKLPPVMQMAFDPTTQALVDSQIENFVNANQITTQEAIYKANQSRAQIKAAIEEAEELLGVYSSDVVQNYRELANSVQETTEAAIATAQSKIKKYTVPRPMSLRMVAMMNGLSYDRQNDIEFLNPFLPSVNYLPEGYVVLVPAA